MTWRWVSACCRDRGEVLPQAGAFQGFGVAAFGEQPRAGTPDQEAVEESVGELDGGGVPGELGLGDVADDRDVRAGGGRRRGPGQAARVATVPRRPECRRQRRDLAGRGLQNGRELGLDDEQPLVVRAGVLLLGVADGPDQPSPLDSPVVTRAGKLGCASESRRAT